MEGNAVLITGGASGIGYALAEQLCRSNKVVICGRREDRLEKARDELSLQGAIACDISKEEERESLFGKVESDFGGINVLINNAGIQRRIDLRKGMEDLLSNDDEIETNLKAQIYLTAGFIPMLMKQGEAAIVNVTSGLGFVPLSNFPIYSATKAAMHSFTKSLRYQLKETPIRVFEAIPPTVHDTELKGRPMDPTEWSIPSREMASEIVKGMEENRPEIAAGGASRWISASKAELDNAFDRINR